jgi:uncharacterized protein YjdB
LVSIAITPPTTTLAIGGRVQLTATGTFSDGSQQNLTAIVAWTSSDTTKATVSNGRARGSVTALAGGSVTITAVTGSLSATATITVSTATLTSIAVTPTTATVVQGARQQFIATGTYSDGSMLDLTTQVTWASSNGRALAVSNAGGTQGLATGQRAGTANVTATLNRVTGTAMVTVTAPTVTTIEVTGPDGTTAPTGLLAGQTEQLRAFQMLSNGTRQEITRTAVWASSDTAVATMGTGFAGAGVATAVAGGTASITATVNAVTGTASLSVSSATLDSITMTPATVTLPIGYSAALKVVATYSDGTMLDVSAQATWTTGSQAIATINTFGGTGVVAGVASGTTTISATFKSLTSSAMISVTNATLVSIAVVDPRAPAQALTVLVRATVQLQAVGTFSDGTTLPLRRQVTWSSDNQRVAYVSNGGNGTTPGQVTGVTQGTANITATVAGISGRAALTVTP